MDLAIFKSWLEVVSGIVALIAGLTAAFWAYTKLILERGLLPPTQFDIECTTVGLQGNKMILEILLRLKNLGTCTLIVTNLRVDIRYLDVNDAPTLFRDPEKSTYGRLCFPRSLHKELQDGSVASTSSSASSPLTSTVVIGRDKETGDQSGIQVLRHDTFVQPGVDQIYTFVTAVPQSTTYVRILSSFEYELHPTFLQRAILFVSRRLGLLQYSLDHVRKPHTSERVFKVQENVQVIQD